MRVIHFTDKETGFSCWLPERDFKGVSSYNNTVLVKFSGTTASIEEDTQHILNQLNDNSSN